MIPRRLAVRAGISYGTGAINFDNDAFVFERELRKFPNDTSLENLQQAVEDGDLEAATEAANNLREVAGKLALSHLYASVGPVLAALQEEALPSVEELAEVEAQHKQICDFLATV